RARLELDSGERTRKPDERAVECGGGNRRQGWILVDAIEITERKLAGEDARELESRAQLAGEAAGVARDTKAVEGEVVNAAVHVHLDERPDAGGQFVIGAQLASRLIEVAVVVGSSAAVGEHRILIGGAIEGTFEGDVEPVEALGEAGAAADVGRDRKPREASL